jgi:hypothetical protein
MIVIAHHLGEDPLIQALLGAGRTLSVALVAPSTRVRRLSHAGEGAADGGEPVVSARPGAKVVPAAEARVGSGAVSS